jgi:hypothetical protein
MVYSICAVYTAKRGDRTNLQTKYSLIYCFSLLQEHKFFSRSNPGHFVDLKNLKKCKVVSNNCARLCKEFRRHRIPIVFFILTYNTCNQQGINNNPACQEIGKVRKIPRLKKI